MLPALQVIHESTVTTGTKPGGRHSVRKGMAAVLAAFLFSSAVFALIQFSNYNLADHDGHYHIKMAELIRKQGLPTPFPYLPLTLLDENRFTDHHMLFHVLQSPFTLIGDLRLAAKISAVFFAAMAFSIFAWLLWKYEVPYPNLWVLLLFASSSAFLYRMSMARAQSLSLALQLLACHFLLQRQYKALLVISFVFVWSYNAFPTLAALAAIGLVAFYFCEGKVEWKIPVMIGTGIMLGLIVNPYFPENILFLWNHIVPKILVGKYEITVGSEWYPYNTWSFLRLAGVAFGGYLAALFWTNREEWKKDRVRLFWLLTATLYLLLMMKSRRFVEYFPPVAILLTAFSFSKAIRKVRMLRPAIVIVLFAVLLLPFAAMAVHGAREDVKESKLTVGYKNAALWLQANTPAGSRVFHSDWDDFPMLFFHNSHNTYVAGLDADFLRLEDPVLYKKYETVTRGKSENPAEEIARSFGSEFVFVDTDHKSFLRQLEKDKRFRKLYSDRHASIFRVLI